MRFNCETYRIWLEKLYYRFISGAYAFSIRWFHGLVFTEIIIISFVPVFVVQYAVFVCFYVLQLAHTRKFVMFVRSTILYDWIPYQRGQWQFGFRIHFCLNVMRVTVVCVSHRCMGGVRSTFGSLFVQDWQRPRHFPNIHSLQIFSLIYEFTSNSIEIRTYYRSRVWWRYEYSNKISCG